MRGIVGVCAKNNTVEAGTHLNKDPNLLSNSVRFSITIPFISRTDIVNEGEINEEIN